MTFKIAQPKTVGNIESDHTTFAMRFRSRSEGVSRNQKYITISFAGPENRSGQRYDVHWGTSDSPDKGKLRIKFHEDGLRNLQKRKETAAGRRAVVNIGKGSVPAYMSWKRINATKIDFKKISDGTYEFDVLSFVEQALTI